MNIKSLQEAAQILELSASTLRSAAIAGRFPATKSGKVWLVDLDDQAVKDFKSSLVHKVKGGEKKSCLVCGKEVIRARAKYCSQECYGQTFKAQ